MISAREHLSRPLLPKILPGDDKLSSLISYLIGFNSAWSGGLLMGFREWLLLRVGGGYYEYTPWALVDVVIAKETNVRPMDRSESERIADLLAILDEFLEFREEQGELGIRTVISESHDRKKEYIDQALKERAADKEAGRSPREFP